jgi:phytanoyl-CoA hydroxylase
VAVTARAGSVIVFSSLTPHSTGPNRTDAVRKAYIVQYAPDGAQTYDEQGRVTGGCDAPERQFLVT